MSKITDDVVCIPRKYARARQGPPGPVVVFLLLATAITFVLSLQWQLRSSVNVRISTALSSTREEVVKQVTAAKRDIMKQYEHCSSTWVKDRDVNHRGHVGAACEGLDPTRLKLNTTSGLIAPVVVLSHDRPGYLGRTLMTLLKYWTDEQINEQRFPLFVSVDGTYQPTLLMATGLRFSANIQVIQNVREATACDGTADGYCWLSHHYKMLLQLFFECLKAPRLIFIEEDLAVAADFFSYFAATAHLMEQDSSILCVSAWNDHGQTGRASNTTALYRTDIMPGLGWMLSASVGLEALPGWPGAGWDEYLRDQRFVKGRQCIFPEVARTHTFGEKGASGGIGYKEHLANMVLNKQPVDWAKQDLSYLLKDNYEQLMKSWLEAAVRLDAKTVSQLDTFCAVSQAPDPDSCDLLITYKDNDHFSQLAQKLGPMMWDISFGGKVPRGSYHGTIIVRCRGRRLFIVKQ